MKKKLLFLILISAICLSAGLISYSYAQETPPGGTGSTPPPGGTGSTPDTKIVPLTNPIKANNVQEILFLAVDLAIFIGTILAVLMFIWIGFQFVMAQGSDTKLSEAKKWFMYAAIGTAVLISSKVIVEVIKNTFVSTGIVNESLFKK